MTIKRRTKIIATLGPATDDEQVLRDMLSAGLDLVRLNFSHDSPEQHQQRLSQLRQIAQAHKQEIGAIADLQGPKIRIGQLTPSRITLVTGETFILDTQLDLNAGNQTRVAIEYKQLIHDVKQGDTLLLADGLITLQVECITTHEIICRIISGGTLTSHQGINRLGGGLSAPCLTDDDKQHIITAVTMGVDYIAVSFPRNAEDIHQARQLVQQAGSDIPIIAKIERSEAVAAMDEIIHAADAVMVARGDLGVEIGDAAVPHVQKDIIERARHADKAVITATQMMESMITQPVPTRAEVSDVANAVLDGTDALLLCAETAIGQHPADVIRAVSRICLASEKQTRTQTSRHRLDSHFERTDETIAMATMYIANHFNIKAIVALTESGSTPLWMSRIRSGIPIYGLTRHIKSQRRMTLYRGVYPMIFDPTQMEKDAINRRAIDVLEQQGIVQKGDYIILTKGNVIGTTGSTSTLKIVCVGEE